MRGRSKVLSSFMAVALAVGLMPLPAFAADEGDAASGALMAGQVDFGDQTATQTELQEAMDPQAEEKELDPQAAVNKGAITFGKSYSGSLENIGKCRYTFTLSSASRVTIKGSSTTSVSLKLYDAAGEKVDYDQFSFNSAAQKTNIDNFYYLNAGDYVLEIECQLILNRQDKDYTFIASAAKTGISFEEKQGGSNNHTGVASPIKLGGSYKGQISADEVNGINGRTDYYKFTVPSTRTVVVSASSSHCGLEICLRDAKAKEIGSNYGSVHSKTGVCDISLARILQAGQYYVSISRHSGYSCGAYTFSVKSPSSQSSSSSKQPMYRMFNPKTGEHFYTASVAERDYLKRDPKGKWNYEGVHWSVPATKNAYPVYRLCNPVTGDHHYTMDKNERNHVIKVLKWRDEGIGWYSEVPSRGTRIMRLNNPRLPAGAHHYTTSAAEKRQCLRNGWKDEGYGWYVCK